VYENKCSQTCMSLTIQQNVVLNFDIYWYDKTTLDNKISKYKTQMNGDSLCRFDMRMPYLLLHECFGR
jgi:uncharacterized protein YcfL